MPLKSKEILAHLIAYYGSLDAAMSESFMGFQEGICHNCGYIQGEVEPDARCYKCEECGEFTVYGIEETLITRLY
jgi:predicted Zn-ribbon and HTH transcriptional regulator